MERPQPCGVGGALKEDATTTVLGGCPCILPIRAVGLLFSGSPWGFQEEEKSGTQTQMGLSRVCTSLRLRRAFLVGVGPSHTLPPAVCFCPRAPQSVRLESGTCCSSFPLFDVSYHCTVFGH